MGALWYAVTGGRDYSDYLHVKRVLDEERPGVVVQGECPAGHGGADALPNHLARHRQGLIRRQLMDKVQRRPSRPAGRATALLPDIREPVGHPPAVEVIPEGVRVKDALMTAAGAGELDGVVADGRVEQVTDGIDEFAA